MVIAVDLPQCKRKKIFIGLFRTAETITHQFKLPPNRVVELGSQVSF